MTSVNSHSLTLASWLLVENCVIPAVMPYPCLLLFRVVGYLPGTGTQTTITHGLRAGVAQASGEETAGNANAGVPGANAMGIRAAA